MQLSAYFTRTKGTLYIYCNSNIHQLFKDNFQIPLTPGTDHKNPERGDEKILWKARQHSKPTTHKFIFLWRLHYTTQKLLKLFEKKIREKREDRNPLCLSLDPPNAPMHPLEDTTLTSIP